MFKSLFINSKFKLYILFLIFLSFSQMAFAERLNQIVPLNLNEAMEFAQKSNIESNVELLNIEKAKNDIIKANRWMNPEIMSYSNFGSAGRSEPQLLGVSQEIELGKRSARKNSEIANLNLIEQKYANQLFNINMSVREAYINLIVAKSILNITKEQQELLTELLCDLKKNNNNIEDEESLLEIMQAEIALNLIVAKVNTAKARVERERLNFNKALNIAVAKDVTYDSLDLNLFEKKDFTVLMTPSLEKDLPEFQEIMNLSFQNRFDLKVEKSQMDLAEKNITLAIRQRIPDLELFGGYSYLNSYQNDYQGMLSGGFAGVGIKNIPIFYDYTPEIKNAKIEYEKSKLNYESTKNLAEHKLKSAYEKFYMAKENLEHFDNNIIEKSDEVLKIAKKSFKHGKSTITTFLLIEQSHIDVQTGYIEALSDYYQSWISLLKAVNYDGFEKTLEAL